MALTEKQVTDVCHLWGENTQCRYLADIYSPDGTSVFVCKKKSPDKKIIDNEIKLFYIDMKKTGQDPQDQGLALGDNCEGYFPFIEKKQGYDLD